LAATAERGSKASTAKLEAAVETTAAALQIEVEVSPARYLSHVALLAHDELRGRATGEAGIDLAAGYIAGQFAAAGLKPGGPKGTYFQEFTFGAGKELREESKLIVEGPDELTGDGARAPVLREDFIPFGFSAQGDFGGEVVFIGYGIVNPEKDHDDYASVDVTGKVVLMLRREPPRWRESGYTDHALFKTKLLLASERGVGAVLIVNQDPGKDGFDGLRRFGGREGIYDVPAIHIRRRLAERLLSAGGLESLTTLQRKLDEDGENASGALVGVRIRGTVAYVAEDVLARNVVGVLPGIGPNANEYVVIGGHYDHLGLGRGGSIMNGADDNASGTAGVIEMAWALAETPYRDRSVICMVFAGEEIGLLGSKHFCADPTVPIESIIAMLNMDMIGRLDEDSQANMLRIQGLGTGDSFEDTVARKAEAAGMEYLPQQSALTGSDHASFYRAGVPSLFFFTGVHEDYHRPSDDAENINAKGAARVVELAYHIALDLINNTEAPAFAKVDRPAPTSWSTSPEGGVVMGIYPDPDNDPDKTGWVVNSVFPDGGAGNAGMRAGDQIIEIDGQTVKGIAEYLSLTADKKPGDVLSVTVLRGDKQIKLQVELRAR
jgi:hypothetical protein